ncbi:MAG: family transcriptional regulator, cyclic receptor protein [Solirubrobacteraceae bacterium]|jgi:CRP-like cAMP-binding protein|nr:family transcriptional regulator, cyclic receptor protein [Solirubrobacteraceae bacterium]
MDLNHLRAIPLFASIDEEALRAIAPFVREFTVPAGATVLKEGDFAYELMAIFEGEADVVRAGDRVATLGPGEYFGEVAVLEKTLRTASVVARTPMRLVALSRWHLRRIGDAIGELRATAAERRGDLVAARALP